MPSKSSSMNQMPMQTKIGDASLKFGPDWLRALSSDNSTGGTTSSATGSGPSGGGWASGSGGGGGSGERPPADRSPGSYHHQSSGRDREKEPDRHRYSNHNSSNNSSNANNSSGSSSAQPLLAPNRFKLSEFRYTREEILTLYDKNLQAPDYLTKFGTLFIEKMQPPLAFSQPSEEELRTWHVPQPESSRPSGSGPVGGNLTSPLSRGGGFTPRGRGIDRGGRGGGRGGRGGYYARPHEEEDPRFRQQHPFSRSLSAHERNWVPDRERNGLSGSPPEAENNRGGGGGGGGNWRNRNSDSYSKGGGRFDEGDDGWRNKPRWRREDEEEYTPPRSNNRRVHKSWSDDGTQDLPEWAKDNPSEESGTFDASGAFHDEDRYSAKTNAFELSRRSEGGDQIKDAGKEDSSHSTGSQHDRVQKKTERDIGYTHPNAIIKEQEEEPLDPPRSRSKPSKPKASADPPPPQPVKDEVKPLAKENHRSQSEVKKSQDPPPSQPPRKPVNEEHYRSMSEDADSLVAKLIEDDAAIVHHVREASLPPVVPSIPTSLTSVPGSSSVPIVQQLSTPPPLPPSIGSPEIWFYRDPQGNVQGPFISSEMSLWLSQGYFSGGLYLRRECDKIFITLSEMGKLYGRNPFVNQPDTITPPPLQDGNNGTSALDPLMVEPIHPGHPQFHQKQLFQQQQQQYLLNALQGQTRKETEGWSQSAPGNPSVNSTTAQFQQAQLLLNNMVKAGGGMGLGAPESSPFDLQTLFQRHTQLKSQEKGGEYRNPNAPPAAPSQPNDGMIVDPIQSLLHQLTSMTNAHGQNVGMKSGGGNGWGPGAQPGSWNQQMPTIPTTSASAGNPLWDYREQYLKLQQMKAEEELLARKKKEEELERKRIQEEEEARKRIEEQKRIEMEQEQKRAYEELMQQQQIAAAELARQREELALQQRLQQQELARQRMEQERALEKQREALQKLEQQRVEQQRLEQQRLEQARLEKEREEERERERERERQEQERRVQMEAEEQKRREERRLQQEMQVKKMQEIQQQQFQLQQQQQKMPWNTGNGSQAPRTFLEIQEEETLQMETRRAQQLALKKKQEEEARERQREQQAKSGMSLTWAQPIPPQQSLPIKSLAEIQAEEAAKLEEKRREKELQNRQHNLQQTWNATLTWANRASLNAPPAPAQKGNGSGAWEDGRKKWETEPLPASAPASTNKAPGHSTYGGKGAGTKDPEDSFLKLIQDHGLSVGDGSSRKEGAEATEDPFTQWCYETVQQFAGTVDIPTFINFLKEVESPFEVNDYVRSYLGDGKEVREFGRQFLEKRSRWKNSRSGSGKEAKGFEDNLYRPASTANPPTAEFQEVKGKKGKKGKMQKVDARILGFNTTAAPDRLNVGKRDYGDGSDN